MPRTRIRTLMLVVVGVALASAGVPPLVAAWRYMHLHNVHFTIHTFVGPFTIRF